MVHTQAKAIADQDVMYKYISKNLLFVATVSPKASDEFGMALPEESSLVVYLVDTVTGRILHRMTHHGSQGPVHAVSSAIYLAICRDKRKAFLHAFVYCRFLARTGLSTTTSILEHTDMRCQSLRSMISLGRYASKLEYLIVLWIFI